MFVRGYISTRVVRVLPSPSLTHPPLFVVALWRGKIVSHHPNVQINFIFAFTVQIDNVINIKNELILWLCLLLILASANFFCHRREQTSHWQRFKFIETVDEAIFQMRLEPETAKVASLWDWPLEYAMLWPPLRGRSSTSLHKNFQLGKLMLDLVHLNTICSFRRVSSIMERLS